MMAGLVEKWRAARSRCWAMFTVLLLPDLSQSDQWRDCDGVAGDAIAHRGEARVASASSHYVAGSRTDQVARQPSGGAVRRLGRRFGEQDSPAESFVGTSYTGSGLAPDTPMPRCQRQ